MTAKLILAALVLWFVHRMTLIGMGRPVGHEELIAGFSALWLVGWPIVFFRRAAGWRVLGYVTAPLLYVGVAFFLAHAVQLPGSLHAAWWNHYGETQLVAESVRGLVLTALSALTLETLRASARRADVRTA